MITEEERKQLEKEIRNKIYLEKISESRKAIENGKFVKKTMEELRAMEVE